MSFGATPTDGSTTPIPMSSVVPDGSTTPVALEGGPSLVTSGNTLAPASMYVKDGNDVAQGTSTDAANANSVIGQLKQIKTNTASVTIGSLPTLPAGTNVIGHVIVDSAGNVSVTSLPALPAGTNLIGAVNLDLGGSALSNTNPVPSQDIEQGGYVSASTPPSATNAGSDTAYTFSSQVSRVIIQNNTSANVNYAFDVAASAGSLLLTPGATLVYPKKCTTVHLFTAAAQNINGTVAGNIVVLGAN